VLVEASNILGGGAASLEHRGFVLDPGLHVLHFRDPWTQSWITQCLGVPLLFQQRRCAVALEGRLVPYPLQSHLDALPARLRLRLGGSALRARWRRHGGNADPDLASWSSRRFGHALTDAFFRPYNEKLWGIPLEELSADWVGGGPGGVSARVVLRGVLGRGAREPGPGFWYPRDGGIGEVARAMACRLQSGSGAAGGSCVEVWPSTRLVGLDLSERLATFQDGRTLRFRRLVSTLPLPDLVSTLEAPPLEVRKAAESLRCRATSFLHVLCPKPEIGGDLHWAYAPSPEVPFYRVSFTHNLRLGSVPAGWSALTLELGGVVESQGVVANQCLLALVSMGLLEEGDLGTCEAVWGGTQTGYPVHDHARQAAVAEVIAYLVSRRVACLGRYGRWQYSNMESALLQGRRVEDSLERVETGLDAI
jgi:protoporphyrinogen oxidase